MTIIPEPERKRLIALGSVGIWREIGEEKAAQPDSPYRNAIEALLAAVKAEEDVAREARAEAREERMVAISERQAEMSANALAIANDALSTSRQQATWAKWAAVAAVVALIISKADDISKLIP